MKDYIEILLDNGSKKKMEVVIIFDIEGYEYHYIIYTELDRSHYYLAKFIGEEIVDLITKFDEIELKLANNIFKGVIER
ncbi:MAG: hypothetical protein IJB83_05905 [Bacilli bacterium]|nr:hypothetical protein [Bacilli bacterium]